MHLTLSPKNFLVLLTAVSKFSSLGTKIQMFQFIVLRTLLISKRNSV